MPSFTFAYPEKSDNTDENIRRLFDWSCYLIDELKYILSNLDEYNISDTYTKSVTADSGN